MQGIHSLAVVAKIGCPQRFALRAPYFCEKIPPSRFHRNGEGGIGIKKHDTPRIFNSGCVMFLILISQKTTSLASRHRGRQLAWGVLLVFEININPDHKGCMSDLLVLNTPLFDLRLKPDHLCYNSWAFAHPTSNF